MLIATMSATGARACDFVRERAPTLDELREQARYSFNEASDLVDAEVVTPMWSNGVGSPGPGLVSAATLHVIRHYKQVQSDDDTLIVVAIGSCDLLLTERGAHVRVLLSGGPTAFTVSNGLNNGGRLDTEQRIFNAEIDRLAGAPRPEKFALFPGY